MPFCHQQISIIPDGLVVMISACQLAMRGRPGFDSPSRSISFASKRIKPVEYNLVMTVHQYTAVFIRNLHFHEKSKLRTHYDGRTLIGASMLDREAAPSFGVNASLRRPLLTMASGSLGILDLEA